MKYATRASFIAIVMVLGAGSLLAQSPPYGGYTNSPYYYGTSYGMNIQNLVIKQGTTVLLQNLNSGASAAPFNTFYSAIAPANLIPGLVHTVDVTIGGGYATGATMWVDYDNNGIFTDATERVGNTASIIAGGATGSINFTPPTSVGGVRRFRIRTHYSSTGPSTALGSEYYGECEDYLVNLGFAISSQSPLPTAAQGSAYNQVITATNGVTPYTWTLPVTNLPPGMTATQTGNDLTLAGNPTTVGNFQFTLTCTDSDSPAEVATRIFSVDVVPPPAPMPFLDDFSTAKGWQLGTTWSRGVATAYAPATSPPRSEPGTDGTTTTSDNMILGDNIGADYAANQGATNWVISPMVNCTTGTNVKVRFKRWLGNAIGTSVYLQVSNNGTTWNNVWSSTPATGQSTTRDTAWNLISYPIGTWANGSATVQCRFGVGPTGTTAHTGWCIDDFEIYDGGNVMEVREGGLTGTLINDNQATGGLRNFGNVPVAQQSIVLTIAITNNSAANINFGTTTPPVSPITKTGANPGDFYLNAPAATFINPLPAGQSSTFTVTFYVPTGTPTGVRSATLTLNHNAGGGAGQMFEINVTATVVPSAGGTIEVRLGSVTGTVIPDMSPATGVRNFGNQDPNAGPTAFITIFVINTGAGTLYMTPPDLGGTWYTDFVVDNVGFTPSLTTGQSTSFKVAFDPTSTGVKDAKVRIPNTATSPVTATAQLYEIPVLGTGLVPPVNPALTVKENSGTGPVLPPSAPAPGTTRDFGNQLLTSGPTTALTIYCENSGGGTLTLGTPVLGGAGAAHFVLTTTGFQTSLAGAASTTFSVAFDPSTTGQKVATVTFTHTDTGQTSPYVINITGNGVTSAAVIGVKVGGIGGTTVTNPAPATGQLSFGNRDIGAGPTTAVQIFIENTGNTAMTLGNPSLGGSGSTQFVLNLTGYTLSVPVSGSTSFTVAFDPSTTGVKNATVSFTHNATGTTSSPFILNVTGTGVPSGPIVEVHEGTPTGTVVTSSLAAVFAGGRDCGAVDVAAGPGTPKTIVIVNAGTQPLTLGVPTLTGADASMFTLNTTGFLTTVGAAGSTTFTVRFDPANVGIKDANIEFTHNDTLKPSPFIVPVVGTGTSATGVLITTSSLPAGNVGQPYVTTTLTATMGTLPYTWALRNSTLPPGLTLSPAGDIGGLPTGNGGAFQITVRVTDATGGTNDATFTLAISNAPGLSGPRSGSCSTDDSNQWPMLLIMAALAALAVGGRMLRRV